MKNLIVEGANATGKTTSMNYIRELYPESTFIEFHDFYHEHVMFQFGIDDLFLANHWKTLSTEQKDKADFYLRERNDTMFSLFRSQAHNRNIVERLILTHAVYSELLLNRNITEYLRSQARELRDSNTALLLITCHDDILANILETNIQTREGRNAPRSQYHLKSIDDGIKKNALYREYYNLLETDNKAVVVNPATTADDLKAEVREALNVLSI